MSRRNSIPPTCLHCREQIRYYPYCERFLHRNTGEERCMALTVATPRKLSRKFVK